jgi:hypothetical protein
VVVVRRRRHLDLDDVLGKRLLNLATYKTDGVDLQFDWSFDLSAVGLSDRAGMVRLNSMMSYTRSLDVASLPGSISMRTITSREASN